MRHHLSQGRHGCQIADGEQKSTDGQEYSDLGRSRVRPEIDREELRDHHTKERGAGDPGETMKPTRGNSLSRCHLIFSTTVRCLFKVATWCSKR